LRDEPSDSEENGSDAKTYLSLSLGNWKSLPSVASLREVRPLEGNYSLRARAGVTPLRYVPTGALSFVRTVKA
jgi:hypothetical protein